MSREAFWKVEVNPCAGGPENKFFVQEYMSLGNGRAAIGQVLYVGTYGDCCSLKDELDAGKLDRDAVWENYLQKQFEGYNATFSIYQLKDSMRDRIYMSLSWIRSKCFLVERKFYEIKYMDRLNEGDWNTWEEPLEEIYYKFNAAHPADYHGRSLSGSDVVVIRKDGQEKAYYCDTFGFEEVPEFVAGKL